MSMTETALKQDELVCKTREKFREFYGRFPRWVVAAPENIPTTMVVLFFPWGLKDIPSLQQIMQQIHHRIK